ncbi:MAG: arsenate reductase (glutaredoxin) [Cyclobacteriaceae bacterium]
MATIYHNPRCSKSRQALNLLEEKGAEINVIEYLKDPPTFDQLKKIIGMLQIKPIDLIRKGEPIYKEKYKGKNLSDDEWISAMIETPKLIERPIVIKDGKATVGRPPENINLLFD